MEYGAIFGGLGRDRFVLNSYVKVIGRTHMRTKKPSFFSSFSDAP